MNNTKAYAAPSPKEALAPFSFQRREVQPKDVQIDILFCGVCHSDIHQARDEWGGFIYPMVPGHEIVGRVIKAGNGVTKFKVGDLVGIGSLSIRAGNASNAGPNRNNIVKGHEPDL